MKLTKTRIDALLPGEEVRDGDLKGFGARRQDGAPRYFVQTRIKGRLKRITIGQHGSPWTVETARKRAAELLVAIRSGDDPASERDQGRMRDALIEEVATAYIETHVAKLKPRTQVEYQRLLRQHLVRSLGKRPIRDITPTDIGRVHTRLRGTARTANHVLAVASSLFAWAETHGYRDSGSNPCSKIERFSEVERERYLSSDELDRLATALREAEAGGATLAVAAIRLLLLTGARLSEILTLRWEFVDAERGVLRLPDSKTGAKVIVLNGAALDVLQSLPRLAGCPFVLPGRGNGAHMVNLQKPWRAIRKRAGLDDVRLHDLRHSFASFAVDAGGNLPVIGSLLGHSQPQTTARYAHVCQRRTDFPAAAGVIFPHG